MNPFQGHLIGTGPASWKQIRPCHVDLISSGGLSANVTAYLEVLDTVDIIRSVGHCLNQHNTHDTGMTSREYSRSCHQCPKCKMLALLILCPLEKDKMISGGL